LVAVVAVVNGEVLVVVLVVLLLIFQDFQNLLLL
jgi:hypothetical protein